MRIGQTEEFTLGMVQAPAVALVEAAPEAEVALAAEVVPAVALEAAVLLRLLLNYICLNTQM